MEINRRQFITTAIAGGIAAAMPLSACGLTVPNPDSYVRNTDYSRLDEIMNYPAASRRGIKTQKHKQDTPQVAGN